MIIIGGGLLGCATAYQLAKRKAGKVLLLDANEIASSQASSRAACLLTRARTKPALMEMVQETYDCIDEIEHLLGESLELQQCGSVTISSSDASLKELEALEEAAVRFGIPNERIDRRRLKELLPWMEVSAVEEALLHAYGCVYRLCFVMFRLCTCCTKFRGRNCVRIRK